jgi:hypothetical protein
MTNRDLLFPQPAGEMMHALSLEIERQQRCTSQECRQEITVS